MTKLHPNSLLIKPRPPGKESDCEREALKFLRSWKRARERLAIQRNDPRNNLKQNRVPPLLEPCGCAMPVRCFTDGDGGVLQECLRCGESNTVERRPGIPTVSKARAAELKTFGPVNGDDAA